MSRTKFVSAMLSLDTGKFAQVMREVIEAAQRAAEAMQRFTGAFARLLDADRKRLGARNFTADGLWQSDLCAAWVHDTCGLPDSCDCTCHGGALR